MREAQEVMREIVAQEHRRLNSQSSIAKALDEGRADFIPCDRPAGELYGCSTGGVQVKHGGYVCNLFYDDSKPRQFYLRAVDIPNNRVVWLRIQVRD